MTERSGREGGDSRLKRYFFDRLFLLKYKFLTVPSDAVLGMGDAFKGSKTLVRLEFQLNITN
ncbi:MAG: hypothetical protein D6680_15280 [Cyanobacteria bacterium J007]|nr:MAG: hypothetical protein D6680_15280 [Cyanobacteria bacterium J007]